MSINQYIEFTFILSLIILTPIYVLFAFVNVYHARNDNNITKILDKYNFLIFASSTATLPIEVFLMLVVMLFACLIFCLASGFFVPLGIILLIMWKIYSTVEKSINKLMQEEESE